ncbi:hypothetical protein MTR62_14165 [Novosphingobium sp. 1949]|uniref:MPN domain-containing protein n=1 Tax=Novosphingobium organovorum TaxID=2930092 RepID=A0ABT0BFK0_9SPHN|nr:hypothetical protein [Novosphingobium organovorum]
MGHLVLVGGASRIGGRYRMLIEPALRLGARVIVLAHNHPSGDPTPSGADIVMTRGLLALARVLDVELVDHLVVGGRRVCSMRADAVFAAPQAAGGASAGPAGIRVERASSADCARWRAQGGRRRAAA